jgi:hypothetical protein
MLNEAIEIQNEQKTVAFENSPEPVEELPVV